MMKLWILFASLFMIAGPLNHPLHSYSFNLFNGMTGDGVLCITPTFSSALSSGTSVGLDMIASVGAGKNFDLVFDAAGLDLYPQAKYLTAWLMPRFDFGYNNILAVQFGFNNENPIAFNVFPQYHFFYENDNFAFELNTGVNIPLSSPDVSDFRLLTAPVWKALKDVLYVFVEIDPSYTLGTEGGFNLNINPGIWIGIPGTPHQFCVTALINNITSGAPEYGIGIWYNFLFDSKNGSGAGKSFFEEKKYAYTR